MARALYKEHFGLRDAPFSIAPDPHYLYLSRQHREALAHLLYGVSEAGGFVLLTGEVGTGKTTVCRCLLQQLPEEVDVALIFNPRVNPEELLDAICAEFHIDCEAGHTGKYYIDRLTNWLLANHAKGRRAVLLIDEAQNLSTDVLEQLRLLTNLETSDQKLLQLILLGQPELRDKLAQDELRQFAQRITARFHLEPLDARETSAYVNHRLAVAGRVQTIFAPWALRQIHRASGGVPRLINILCDRVLLGLYAEGRFAPGRGHLRRAEFEVKGRPQRRLPRIGWRRTLATAALGFVLLALVTVGPPELPQVAKTRLASLLVHLTPAVVAESSTTDAVPVARSRDELLPQLLSHYQHESTGQVPACSQGGAGGLYCLTTSMNLDAFLTLHRPGVAAVDTGEGLRFILLREQNGEQLIAEQGHQDWAVSIESLRRQWRGEVTVVSTFPIGQSDRLPEPGDSGSAVAWLKRKLDAYYGTPDSGLKVSVSLFDGRDVFPADAFDPMVFLLAHYPITEVTDSRDKFDTALYSRLRQLRDDLHMPAKQQLLDTQLILTLETALAEEQPLLVSQARPG